MSEILTEFARLVIAGLIGGAMGWAVVHFVIIPFYNRRDRLRQERTFRLYQEAITKKPAFKEFMEREDKHDGPSVP